MEYMGIEYTVVRTANPTGWKWIVTFDGKRTQTGTGFSRFSAIRFAERVINRYLKTQARKHPAELTNEHTA